MYQDLDSVYCEVYQPYEPCPEADALPRAAIAVEQQACAVPPPPPRRRGPRTNKSTVDTSSFTIEQRLVTAVWVHERKTMCMTIAQIKREFRQRFGREPPAKNTLLAWERKLFATGSVWDAPRPGRPLNRSTHAAVVSASMRAAPTQSLRARAAALRLPRTTLRAILSDLRQASAPIGAQRRSARGKSDRKGARRVSDGPTSVGVELRGSLPYHTAMVTQMVQPMGHGAAPH